jgi:hypothetical protein
LLAAVVGLCLTHSLPGQEPARLAVEPSPGVQPSTNQAIATAIAVRLTQSGQLRHYTVNVAFQDGTAELTGSVADPEQREAAVRLAQGVAGVERVRDRLVVTGSGTVTQIQAVAPPKLPEPGPLPHPEKAPPPAGADARATDPMPIFQAPCPSPYDANPPKMPPYAWPSYAPYNNYSRVAYPTLYPYQSWPFIGPAYPFPKVPLGWRSVKLTWEDGHWWYGKNASSHDWWKLRYW